MTMILYDNNTLIDPADDDGGLKLGLCALRRMAAAAWIELDGIATECAMDIGLAGQVVRVFEEMGYARRLPTGTAYALTPAGRSLARSLQMPCLSGDLH